MVKLHPLPSDGRFYCGPSAIAAFTGFHPKGIVRQTVNSLRGRHPSKGIMGMKTWEVAACLRALDVACREPVTVNVRQTLQEFMRARPDFCGVVNVTHHFVAVAGGLALDNKSRIPRPIHLFPGHRKLVAMFIELIP
jgi:hypothetical protein